MGDHFDSWVTVVPAPDQVKETARALLALAPDPRDVRTLGNGAEFLVPAALADAYEAVSAPAPAVKPKSRARAKKESE